MKIKRNVTFRKLDRKEIIQPSDFHSLDDGDTLCPIVRTETIGDIPENFSNDRSFWRVESIK